MKGYVLKSPGLVVVVTAVMLVVLVFAAAAGAKVPVAGDGPTETLCPPPSDGSKQKAWGALDRVNRFQETLGDAGFGVQEGKFAFWDLVKDTCEGKIRDARGQQSLAECVHFDVLRPARGRANAES